MRSRPSPRRSDGTVKRAALPWLLISIISTTIFLASFPAAGWAAGAGPEGVKVFGATSVTPARALPSPVGPAAEGTPAARPHRSTFHIGVFALPIPSLPTEDVDVVEVAVPASPIATTMAVWPTEGTVYFLDESTLPATVIATVPTASPNITGVDFVSDGTWGAFATLGFVYIFDMTTAAGPTLTAPPIPLPGTPARRDIDPILIPHPGSPTGVAVLYATGTEIHCFAVPTGLPLWGPTPLPSPIVEAVDPVINSAGTLLFVPSVGFMTAIDPVTGVVLSSTPLGTTLVREVDATFAVGDAFCYLPVNGALWVFDGTPPAAGGIGVPLATLPIGSPLIEGNDLEIDPTGTFGFLPSLAFMYQVDLGLMAYAFVYPFPPGTAHQRNQDAVFTPPGVVPPKAVYCVQGASYIYDVFAPGAPPLVVPVPGTLVDGVDPAFTDTPPFGAIFTVSTLGFTHIIDAIAGGPLPFSPVPTPGVLRTDVDSKPGPLPGNQILQPTIGGLMTLTGFFPDDWVVSTANGVWVVNLAGVNPPEFIPTPLLYRGGDAQPTALLGPPEPSFSVDQPDQDFLTKCWEYKFALNRWPYWWYHSSPFYYPRWVPLGVFGPPALAGYDVLNHYKVLILEDNSVEILDERGTPIQNIPMPAPIQSGLIWDWDNKICKVRLHTNLEAIIKLSTIPSTGFATVSFQSYGNFTRWYPVVDRMNGWEYVVYRGGRRVWIYDHMDLNFVGYVDLESDVIRRPVFDDQRKVLCLPLANYKLAYINGFRLRFGLPKAVYYTPSFGAHIVGSPVFDVYNHYTICKLRGGRIGVVDNDDATIVWDSGILPYWPISPIRVDCYNKVAKGFFRDALFNYYEMRLDLYPLVFGGLPVLQWLPVGGVPYGYPLFDSRDGYEFYRIDADRIHYSYVFNPAIGGTIFTPFPMVGNLFMDRVNKYGLVRLTGPRMLWLNLFRITQGLPGATNVINLQDGLGNPVAAEDDIVFDTQGHYAAVHLANGQVALIDMEAGVQTWTSTALPTLTRQLYVHPFRHLVNYPWQAGDVTLDLSPVYHSPPGTPYVNVVNTTAPPLEAVDFTAPPAPPPPIQLAHEGGNNIGMVQFEFPPGTLEPGSIIQITNDTRFETDRMDDPNEAVAEFDGSAEATVIADVGDVICFVAFDLAGNASPPTCINVGPTTGVGDGAPAAFAFARITSNPARQAASFRFALPAPARVDLAVYDLAGRRISTLVRADLPAGQHESTWLLHGADGGPVGSGVYFVRIRAGAHEAVESVVVIR